MRLRRRVVSTMIGHIWLAFRELLDSSMAKVKIGV